MGIIDHTLLEPVEDKTPVGVDVYILQQGAEVWNQWRDKHHGVSPQLAKADLGGVDLSGADLSNANLSRANLSGANLSGANFSHATLWGTDLSHASLNNAFISYTDFTGAFLSGADLSNTRLNHVTCRGSRIAGANLERASIEFGEFDNADLTGVNLRSARLFGASLKDVKLDDADLTGSVLLHATFNGIDLSRVIGLATVRHMGRSSIGIDTVFRSQGNIPEEFLRGCGLPDEFITYMKSLTANPIQFYACFISHSSKDQACVARLYADLQNNGVRCWMATEDMKIGAKTRTSIDEAIRLHDKLLLVLSKHSVASDWVEQEVETALERERKEKRLVLIPIRLDDAVMDVGGGWPALIKNTRNIGDFRRWKNHDSYSKSFAKLVRDLKATD